MEPPAHAGVPFGMGDTKKATKLIREIWVHGNFGAQQERQFYRQFRRYMTREDHIERLDRLLWAGKYFPVRRMYRRIHADYRALAEARLALKTFPWRRGPGDLPGPRIA